MLLDKMNKSSVQMKAEHVRNVEYLRCMQEDVALNDRMVIVDMKTDENYNEAVDVAEVLDIERHLGDPKDDYKEKEIEYIMSAAKNISLDDIMGVGAECGPAYESALQYEEAFIEGTNIDMLNILKSSKKKFISDMKYIRKLIKEKDYNTAKRELDALDKSFDKFKKDFKKIDSGGLGTAVLGSLLIEFLDCIDLIIVGLPTLGVGAAVVSVKKYCENVIGFIKEVTREVKEDDFSVKMFNSLRNRVLLKLDGMSKQIKNLKEALSEDEEEKKEEVKKEAAEEVVQVGHADPIVASNEVESNPSTVTTEPVDGKTPDHCNEEAFGQVEPEKGQKFEAADLVGDFNDIEDALKFFDADYSKSNADKNKDGQRDLEVDTVDKTEVPVLTKAEVEESSEDASVKDEPGVEEDNKNLERDAYSFFNTSDNAEDKDNDGIPDNQDDATDLPESNELKKDEAEGMVEISDGKENPGMEDVPKLSDPEEEVEELEQKSAYESVLDLKKLLDF